MTPWFEWRDVAVQQPPPPPPPPPPAPPFPLYGQQPYAHMQPYASASPPPRSRRRWWLWGCGGCGALALVVIAVIVVVGINTFTNSPLRHFPIEAGASTAHDSFQLINGHSSETLAIDDPHALTDVERFYQTALPGAGWTVESADPSRAISGDSWHLSRSGSPSQSGVLSFVVIGATTRITVEYAY